MKTLTIEIAKKSRKNIIDSVSFDIEEVKANSIRNYLALKEPFKAIEVFENICEFEKNKELIRQILFLKFITSTFYFESTLVYDTEINRHISIANTDYIIYYRCK